MMLYILIVLSLSLAGVAGLQFFYLLYLERINNEQRKRIYELERHSKYVSKRLTEAERRIAELNEFPENLFDENEEEVVWSDVIDDR